MFAHGWIVGPGTALISGSWKSKLLIVFGYVCLKASLGKSSTRHIHWNWLVIHVSRGIRRVILRSRRCLSSLILVSSIKEAWLWLLGSERILECAGRWIVASSSYPFNELFGFGHLYGMIFDIVVGGCKWWFHYIFK